MLLILFSQRLFTVIRAKRALDLENESIREVTRKNSAAQELQAWHVGSLRKISSFKGIEEKLKKKYVYRSGGEALRVTNCRSFVVVAFGFFDKKLPMAGVLAINITYYTASNHQVF